MDKIKDKNKEGNINVYKELECNNLYLLLPSNFKGFYKRYYIIYNDLGLINNFTDFLLGLNDNIDNFNKFTTNRGITKDSLFLLIQNVKLILNNNNNLINVCSEIKGNIDIILLSKFDEIYEEFDNTKSIMNDNLKGVKGELFDKFMDFCNFLIYKIEKAGSVEDVINIPKIISNLSTYYNSSNSTRIKRFRKNSVISKRNEIADLYYKKFPRKNIRK